MYKYRFIMRAYVFTLRIKRSTIKLRKIISRKNTRKENTRKNARENQKQVRCRMGRDFFFLRTEINLFYGHTYIHLWTVTVSITIL